MEADAVAEEESDGAEKRVFENTDGVDVDSEGGSFGGEEIGGDPKYELVVPRRVFAAKTIDARAELASGVNVCDGVSLEAPDICGGRFEILGGDQVDLKKVGGFSGRCWWWKGCRGFHFWVEFS